jgi:hypothetical protein
MMANVKQPMLEMTVGRALPQQLPGRKDSDSAHLPGASSTTGTELGREGRGFRSS